MNNKAGRLCYKISHGPFAKRFGQERPVDLSERRKRLQLIAQGLQKTGRKLADANNKKDLP